jgi:hypothetical protein
MTMWAMYFVPDRAIEDIILVAATQHPAYTIWLCGVVPPTNVQYIVDRITVHRP